MKPAARKRLSWLFGAACGLMTLLSVGLLFLVLGTVLANGYKYLHLPLLTNASSTTPAKAGVYPALMGSLWLMGLTALIAVPVGVGTAIYLEEYAKKNRWNKLIQLNISNLAAVPSVVYGILGLGLFVYWLKLGHSVITGALTLSLVVLPIIILAAQEALRGVPQSIRQGSYALGASRWQTVRLQVLPASIPGIMTGVILAISRALGETAPLLAIGAVAIIRFPPTGLGDTFTALPIQIFQWASDANRERHLVAGSAIILLLAVLILMNTAAILIRRRYSRRIKW